VTALVMAAISIGLLFLAYQAIKELLDLIRGNRWK